MVKRQRERQYQSATEHRQYAKSRSGVSTSGSTVQRRLPFSHCALTLTPYESPVCNSLGIVFENTAIMPFVMKHKMDPVTGEPMTTRNLITLHMDKDEEGKWQCPVLTKAFSDQTKIVAIVQPSRTEANVYSYEAYRELNVKAKNYEDLISGVKFDKAKDVLQLNDPDDDELNGRRDINSFYHVLHARELEETKMEDNVRYSKTATRVMEQLQKQKQEAKLKKPAALPKIATEQRAFKVLAKDVTGVHYTTGKASSSLTSTSMDVRHDNESREATEEEILRARFAVMRKLKKKGLVRLQTNLGPIMIELHCDIAPRTCTNFLGLCEAGKYNGNRCHRLIRNFMAQFGKASGEEQDQSIWGGAFFDEFDDRLKHAGAGILSMANSGKHTNRQQFFVTFRSCPHLDRKHSVFGQVIDGLDVVEKMEGIPTDKKERPQQPIVIESAEVLLDPAAEARQMEEERLEEIALAREGKSPPKKAKKSNDKVDTGVGRYLKDKLSTGSAWPEEKEEETAAAPSRLPPPPKKTTFGNFSGW